MSFCNRFYCCEFRIRKRKARNKFVVDKFVVFDCWTNLDSRAKRVVFVHTTVFEQPKNWEIKNLFCKRSDFLFTRGFPVHGKQFLLTIFWLRGLNWLF